MDFEHLDISTDNHITRITLNRPEVLNAINVRIHAAMIMAIYVIAADAT